MAELTSPQRLMFARAAVDLRDLPAADLAALVDAMTLRAYPVRHVFYGLAAPGVPGLARPLRLVVSGRVIEQPGLGPPRVLGPGALLGIEGVAAYAGQQELGPPDRGPGPAAHVLDPCSVLEVGAEHFPALLGGPDRQAAREHFLGLRERQALAPSVARTLAGTPELADVRLDRLLELQRGARLGRLAAGETIAIAGGKSPPADVIVVLGGRVKVLVGANDVEAEAETPIRRGSVIAQTYVLRRRTIRADLRGLVDARLLFLPARRYQALLREAPDFRRAIERALGGGG